MITADIHNTRAGVCSTEYLHYGSTTYGGDTYELVGYYQSPIITRTRIDYTSSGDVWVQYRSGYSSAFSSWSVPVTAVPSGSIVSAGNLIQFRVMFYQNDWASTDSFEVINAI